MKYRYLFVLFFLLTGSACTTYEYHETRANQLDRAVDSDRLNIDDALLDVGVVLFEEGVDEYDEESIAYANVRRSEAVWFSDQIKKSIENSNAWGIVRTLPNENSIFDLTVTGQILESNGEDLHLYVEAYDAVGNQWLSKEYFQRASQYAYNPEIELNRDPFQNLFNDIANDLYAVRNQYDIEELRRIREIARIRFAQEFAPDAFSGYLQHNEQEGYQLLRLPAESDPSVLRIERIKARNDLFLDVIQDYYRIFNNNMSSPYDEWRKLSYKEVLYQRQLSKQAKQERVAGVAIILSGVLAATGGENVGTRAAGHVGITAGADLFAKSYNTETEASLHAETLREFGESLEVELEPSVIDLQDRTVTLTGTVEDQYKEWKKILRDMYQAEQAISNPQQTSGLEVQTESESTEANIVRDGVAKQDKEQPLYSEGL